MSESTASLENGNFREGKPQTKTRPTIIAATLIAVAAIASVVTFFCMLGAKQNAAKEIPRINGFVRPAGLAVGKYGGVAAEEERCSQIGIQVLKDGGNAVDAAIASSLCSGVVNPFSSGIGGGGFMVFRLPNGDADVIDFRETAPAGATEDMFGDDPMKSRVGGLAVAVPGEIRGYEAAHKKYGNIPWGTLFQPTIDLCDNGYNVSPELHRRLTKHKVRILSTPSYREIFTVTDPTTNQTDLAPVGTRLYNRNLGKTLRAIAKDGPSAFYTGPIAASIIKTIRSDSNPGIMTLEDLKNYTPIFRKPVIGSYRGQRIITTPAPTSGPVLLQILNILEGYDLKHGEAGPNAVVMVEAMKWAFSSRTKLADPGFHNISEAVAEMVDKSYSEKIRLRIKNNETFPGAYYSPQYETIDTPGTMHVGVVDKDNMAVALTSTINIMFGAWLMDIETGIILNSEMDDFSSKKVTNYFGLPPAEPNFIKPGKRPLSSTTPTIIDGEGLGTFGGSGGSRIISSVAQSILNVIDYGMDAYEAVAAARVHHQLYPEELYVDEDYAAISVYAFHNAGHNVTMVKRGESALQVVVRLADGTINAGSDPRKQGIAAAY